MYIILITVTAINRIKANYQVNKNWSGDPCVPNELSWTGVTCADYNNIPRITSLNLSSSGLTGVIVSSFGNLSTLKSLYVCYTKFLLRMIHFVENDAFTLNESFSVVISAKLQLIVCNIFILTCAN
ncbi:Leucine-rich repeat protein kinase [Rhynchospora pubera]|uniref:Leucine-rich repeat protein kinase n=1 Tax=Rhynchospora pubera TaxID=906938 RepID=A0AAV8DX58_9POAL|nr:Leucine-rich repeat protein kinase [Rhynchospora pubera]